jgi:branched-chain amino acid aminotransferase
MEEEYELVNGIRIENIPETELKKKYQNEDNLGFGKLFTDRMFFMEYKNGEWQEPTIKKYENLSLSPAAKVLHYSQEIFEGMKAYRTADGHVNLFRPDMNIARFNNSAKRMMMPQIDPDLFLESLSKLIELEKDWIPISPGSSLYVRPTYIGITPSLGVQPATEYYYYVILSPSGSYFPEGYNPIKIYVQDQYVRAVKGGTGSAKTGGNYSGSLLAGKEAADHGCSQVLWLDAIHHKYVEEVGAMNIFFVKDDIIYTAPLSSGTILPGVTRNSTITLAKDLGYTVKEEALNIEDVIAGIHSGSVSEIFGAGTAASIAPVGSLYFKGEFHEVNHFQIGEKTKKLYKNLTDIQWSRKLDPYGWVYRVI